MTAEQRYDLRFGLSRAERLEAFRRALPEMVKHVNAAVPPLKIKRRNQVQEYLDNWEWPGEHCQLGG